MVNFIFEGPPGLVLISAFLREPTPVVVEGRKGNTSVSKHERLVLMVGSCMMADLCAPMAGSYAAETQWGPPYQGSPRSN
jgi:hypothetical protein